MKNTLNILFTIMIYAASLYLLFSYDWHIGLGVLLFGWAMNMETSCKRHMDA